MLESRKSKVVNKHFLIWEQEREQEMPLEPGLGDLYTKYGALTISELSYLMGIQGVASLSHEDWRILELVALV